VVTGFLGAGKTTLIQNLLRNANGRRLALIINEFGETGIDGELVKGWSQTLGEVPPTTILFNELEFSQAQEIGTRRPDLPVGPVMDFLLDLIDRTIAADDHLVVGSTNHPDTMADAFAQPGRFERIVEVNPIYPDDIVEALKLHAAACEKRAGHALFEDVEWPVVVSKNKSEATGDWIRILHHVLRRKARCEAAGETVALVSTLDLEREVDRARHVSARLRNIGGGNYV